MIYFLLIGVPLVYAKSWLASKVLDTSGIIAEGVRVGCDLGTRRR